MRTDKQVLDVFRGHAILFPVNAVIFPVNLDLCAQRVGIDRQETCNGHRRIEGDGTGYVHFHCDFFKSRAVVGLAAFHLISTCL